MTPYLKTLPLLLVLAACGDGQPFFNDEVDEALEEGDEDEVADGVVPEAEPEARDGINFETSGGLPPERPTRRRMGRSSVSSPATETVRASLPM